MSKRVDVIVYEVPPRRVEFVCKWYDFWIGLFYDRERRWLYVLPIFCVGVRIKIGALR